MVHNNIRFGLLYLNDDKTLQMIRLYSAEFPKHMQQSLKLINESNVWKRKRELEKRLEYDFAWFVKKFRLKDQIGNKIDFK